MGEFTINAKQLVLDWMGSSAFTPVNKAAAKKIGYKEAGLLGEIINQYKRWYADSKLDENGWFFWTEDSCEEETTFPPSTQKKLFKKLEEAGCLTRHKKRRDPKRVETTRFIELHFTAIAGVMLEPEGEKEKRQELRKERREKQKEYKKKYDENSKDQNEPSEEKTPETLEKSTKDQNEPSRKDQNEPSSKDQNELLIKKDLELKKNFSKKELDDDDGSAHINEFFLQAAKEKGIQEPEATEIAKEIHTRNWTFTKEQAELAIDRTIKDAQRGVDISSLPKYTAMKLEKILKAKTWKGSEPKTGSQKRAAAAPGIKVPDWLKPATQEVAAAAEEPKHTEEENRKWLEELLGSDMK